MGALPAVFLLVFISSVYIGMSSILRGEHECFILACISSSGANIGAKEKK